MKALVIRIRDAGIFKNPRISGSQDKVLDCDGYRSRFDRRSRTGTPYIETVAGRFNIKHVANLLRVLWGERPVPSLRKVSRHFVGDPAFEDLAKKVLVKIDSPVLPGDKAHKDKAYYPEETTTVRKSIGDSWQTATSTYILDGNPVQVRGGLLYPDRLLRFLGKDLYEQYKKLVTSYGGGENGQGGDRTAQQS
jgi:hypothetical protein